MARKITEEGNTRVVKHPSNRNKDGSWREKRSDAGARAREIRARFRSQGRRFSDSAELVREDRDTG